MNIIAKMLVIWAGIIFPGCAYRLTNKTFTPPANINAIAIESPYNTSEQVLPMEILWNQVQREFIKFGQPRLTSRKNADAIMTIKIVASDIKPTGTASIQAIDQDPSPGSGGYEDPNAYPNLKKAGRWTILSNVSFIVLAEVYDLRTRQKIFTRKYPRSLNFHSIRSSPPTEAKANYLMYEEAINASFKKMSKSISSRIVQDFLN